MAFGLGKIPGHSGASRKPRKSFRGKTYDKSSKSEIKNGYRVEYQSKNSIYSKYLKVSIFIIALILFFYLGKLLYYYFDSSRIEDHPKINYPTTFEEYKEEKTQEEYDYLVKSGYINLKNENFDFAQNEFTRAIKLNGENKMAYLGFTKVLIQKCSGNNIYCHRAKEYIQFLEKSKLMDKQEISVLSHDLLMR